MMILGSVFSCLDPILSVVTSLDGKSPFYVSVNKRKESEAAADRMSSDTFSDHLAVANAVAAWDGLNSRNINPNRNEGAQQFCYDNFCSQVGRRVTCGNWPNLPFE